MNKKIRGGRSILLCTGTLWRHLANMNSTQHEQIYTTAEVVVCGRPL